MANLRVGKIYPSAALSFSTLRQQLEFIAESTNASTNAVQRAVDAVANHPFDLILMDCHMQEMDGLTATGLIRTQEGQSEQPRHATIVALTANALEGDRDRCLAAGMDDYLIKPFTLAKLRDLQQRWLPTKTSATPAPAPPPSEVPKRFRHIPSMSLLWQQISSIWTPAHGMPFGLANGLANATGCSSGRS